MQITNFFVISDSEVHFDSQSLVKLALNVPSPAALPRESFHFHCTNNCITTVTISS